VPGFRFDAGSTVYRNFFSLKMRFKGYPLKSRCFVNCKLAMMPKCILPALTDSTVLIGLLGLRKEE
jgi:hypothetical protein